MERWREKGDENRNLPSISKFCISFSLSSAVNLPPAAKSTRRFLGGVFMFKMKDFARCDAVIHGYAAVSNRNYQHSGIRLSV